MWAGAAAALTGSAYLVTTSKYDSSASSNDNCTTTIAACAASSPPAPSADANTVVGMLQGIAGSVANIEATLGSVPKQQLPRRHGIDVVLGAQWGDEGKGKLVDILSQVRRDLVHVKNPFLE
jgi:hypothetical protein